MNRDRVVIEVLGPLHTISLGLLMADDTIVVMCLISWVQVQVSLASMEFITVELI